ncbi:MAG TPA: DUF2075 domain-containing protein [Chitinophagaceae bacterium]
MIIYQNSKGGFLDDVLSNNIENIIHDVFKAKLNQSTSTNEIRSWKESLMYMDKVLSDASIPEDCGVAIEYRIPQTCKRVDFILTGQGKNKEELAIIVELKQWTEAQLTEKDGVVKTRFARGSAEVSHPSYQAWSYAMLLQGFNETVYSQHIQLKPCAYLHNYVPDGVIDNDFYREHIANAPLFLRTDAAKLRNFIKEHVKYGDSSSILYRIDCGRIRPSKMLSDSLASMLKGNQEFIMIDEQKVVYETAMQLTKLSTAKNKHVLIVEGGPGTGKSVVAINLLVNITKELGLLTHYVTKNAAPRAVYESRLTGTLKKTQFSNMFKGSGAYLNTPPNTLDCLVVDEAHRLNEKSGLYANNGENQIKEIINAAKCSVFFIDEDQRIHLNDIGEKREIRKWASKLGATVHEMELASQFRCNGSDGYLAWLDHVLQIRQTANETLEGIDYDFRVFDSPAALRDAIVGKNRVNNKARLVAGYCWDWASKKNPEAYDIVLGDDFKMRWNLTTDGSLWLIAPNSVNEIGCIHTCQGLEVDYAGVIVGDDLVVRDGLVVTNPAKRSRMDASIKGYRKLLEKNYDLGKRTLEMIIKNTYRTLMTRGMKGCYVYFTDKETEEFFSTAAGMMDTADKGKTMKLYGENDQLTSAAEE